MLKEDCEKMLKTRIIPFWKALADERGGFFGRMDQQGNIFENSDKGVILNSRILWFFSSAYTATGDASLLEFALHAYDFCKDRSFDTSCGGVYWMMDCDGEPSDTMKHTYNQAFAIYALSAYYEASGNEEAKNLALKLYHTIESKAFDGEYYGEAFDREWNPAENEALSENGIKATRTMNTVLHLIEAYTGLFAITHSPEVEYSLRRLLSITRERIFDRNSARLRVFFDAKMNALGDIHSYGHDIEASWLLDRACETLGDAALVADYAKLDLGLADKILDIAFENGALNNERDGKTVSKKRIWWVQAEGIVGFVNAYQKSGERKFLETAESIFNFVNEKQVDPKSGEWFPEIAFDGTRIEGFDMVGPWKCPYHNGRMCIEVMMRL